MISLKLFYFASIIFAVSLAAEHKKTDKEEKLMNFIKEYESKIEPLYIKATTSSFDASISGDKDDFKRSAKARLALSKIHTDRDDYSTLKTLKGSDQIKDPYLRRQLDLIYNAYKSRQIDPKRLEEIINLNSQVELVFSTFRAKIGDDEFTDNQIEEILKTSTDNEKLKAAWLASKEIGPLVVDNVIKLVKMRNESARELGFKNYHEMSLKLNEQDPEHIERLFDELDTMTRSAYRRLKRQIDSVLAKKYSVRPSRLMPWHYQNRFFQEAPRIYDIDLDKYYADKDLVKITADYFRGIGLPIDNIIENSDLYEKPNKYQHAYCTNIDRRQDIRVVCNVKPNAYWMDTLLHEYGHAVYEKWLDQEMPWVFRTAAHTFTTEAIAMLFGRLSTNPRWMHEMLDISEEERDRIYDLSFKVMTLKQLVFSRWSQVMYRFEKAMYENPDQDLNRLWWRLVRRYQGMRPPRSRNEPDWVTKIHVALYPAYYHNYLMGELLASQLHYYIVRNVLNSDDLRAESYTGRKELGKYLIENVFSLGSKYHWNDMIKKATGEYLTPLYYSKQFVE